MKNVGTSEKIFIIASYVILAILAIIIIIPLFSVVISSFVSAAELARRGQFILWPEHWDTSAYAMLFRTDRLYSGYANTLFVTIFGTCLSTFIVCVTRIVRIRRIIWC